MERAYLASSVLLNAVLFVLGLGMLASTLARGGGPLALGVVLGLALTVLGAARLWLVRRGGGSDRGA
ncbi:MAG: hypothetical protein WKF32_02415 [Thermoleophilaceae bacterium]